MKRIGYQAFLGANYGTILQTLGLYTKMLEKGYDCEIIGCAEFLNRTLIPANADMNSKLYDTQRTQLTYEQFIYRYFKFNKILNVIDANAVISEEQKREIKNFDAFISGSDQIWKPSGFWFHAKRYLQYAPECKRIAYAPSIGIDKVPFADIKNIPQWRRWIESIPYRSIREKSGAHIVDKLIGQDIPVVLDPSLLLTSGEWTNMLPYGVYSDQISKQLATGRPYLLAYLLDTYDIFKNYITSLARILNLDIIWLCGRDNTGPVQINSTTTDPAGFINLVKNASYICTDGYHGCCFAINFEKPFTSMVNNKFANISRVGNLLELLGIPNRFVYPDSVPEKLDYEVNYQKITEKLVMQRDFSISWLLQSLDRAIAGSCKAPWEFSKPAPEKFVRKFNRVPLDDPNNCTGCGACMNICPVNAIEMKASEFGFLRPEVNADRCILCGKCLNNCPLRKRPSLFYREKPAKAWAAWATNPFIISKSASGGVFALMAEWMIKSGGVVYGVKWDENLQAKTVCAENIEELKPLLSSKYVQADTGWAFTDVKKNLDKGIPVLFSGTSCQVAGLYAFLGGDHENLITTDLICSGTPAQAVLNKYMAWRENQQQSKLTGIEFRSKKRQGWGSGGVLKFANAREFQFPWQNDEYGMLYTQHFIQNTACFVCRFRGIDKRWADITIGDFWGIGRQGTPFNYPTSQGVSVILPNSIKGRAIFSAISNKNPDIMVVERPLEEVYPGNAWLLKNYGKRPDYKELAELLSKKTFDEAFNTYFGTPEIREHLDF